MHFLFDLMFSLPAQAADSEEVADVDARIDAVDLVILRFASAVHGSVTLFYHFGVSFHVLILHGCYWNSIPIRMYATLPHLMPFSFLEFFFFFFFKKKNRELTELNAITKENEPLRLEIETLKAQFLRKIYENEVKRRRRKIPDDGEEKRISWMKGGMKIDRGGRGIKTKSWASEARRSYGFGHSE